MANKTGITEQKTQAFVDCQNHRMLIGGQWVDALNNKRIEVINPANETVIGNIPCAQPEDVNKAVSFAKDALEQDAWGRMRPSARQNLLLKLADLIERDARIIAELEAVDNGKSADIALAVDVGLGLEFFRYMAGWATKIEGSTLDVSVPMAPPEADFFAYTRREPVGVVAAIIPWNFPFLMACWKIAPALAAGCTVILKPAEQTSLSALYLGQLIEEVGFPAGVVNIITGDGQTTGSALTKHPGINKISFTGSTQVGQMIGRAAMDNMARVTLELGGKSPMIVLKDCDPEKAAQGAAQAIFFNHGQVCSAGSRLYVHRSIFDTVVSRLVELAEAIPMGPGLDSSAQMGPLVSQVQLDRVCQYIESGRKEGARLVTGGERVDRKGYYVKPTIFTSEDDSLVIAREEIFGPVLVVIPFDDVDEAVRRANDSPYGLAASIWSNDLSLVQRLIPKLKAGTVWVNGHNMLDAGVPFGGYKLSGVGRDMGKQSLDSYLETKSVFMAL
ncbi:aldehyde dehydrogenase family protein [Marinobacter sp. M3C]|uniref:aldehyde dehydrogenase family protein n=1 Tax=Marinobacter sp. M3C TaxID=2917715 RepID=UPI00200BAE7A|nr:aldehyde dehydrogenase family protein [Marinobacter sp. M3C]UQG62530.1 aldehyde dehydrogenase family protein [Marinobacter sp. M3C]